jgi:hypothetical protein
VKPENVPNDEPVGRRIWSGGSEGPLTTARFDLLAAGLGVLVAVTLGVLTPLGPVGAAIVAGPVAGLANRVHDAELGTGFVSGTAGAVALAGLGLATDLLGVGAAASGGVLLGSPFVGLLAGGLAIPFGRARQRFADGRRGR